jgi:putative FmdB family regulatory protein
MPTYDYRCTSCEKDFEVSRGMRATGEECCPFCGAPAVKIFSPVSVAFKGSGFHNTDYRTKPVDPTPDAPKAEPACPKAESSAPTCAGCPAAAAAE